MKDGEKLLPKPHKRIAQKPRYNMDVSSSSGPFPSPHIALDAGLQVAGEKISVIPAKQNWSQILNYKPATANSTHG